MLLYQAELARVRMAPLAVEGRNLISLLQVVLRFARSFSPSNSAMAFSSVLSPELASVERHIEALRGDTDMLPSLFSNASVELVTTHLYKTDEF